MKYIMDNTKPAPFRADHVSSLLRPQTLKDARQKFKAGAIDEKELKNVEDQEIKRVIKKQQDIGLKSITDGEFRRSWFHLDFMGDFQGAKMVDGPEHQFKEAKTRAESVEVFAPIRYNPKHLFFEHFEFLNTHVKKGHVAKMAIPSPNLFFIPSIKYDTVYDNLNDFAADVSEAYRKTIEHFYDIGCRYLQLDDVLWANFVDEKQKEVWSDLGYNINDLKQLAVDTLNRALADKPEDMLITMHICRGNFRSTWIYSGGYDKIADHIFSIKNIDGFFLEYDDDRSGDFKPLLKSNNQNIVLGLVTSKVGEMENAQNIKNRIKEAAEYVPLKNLYLSPQCGFSSTEEGNKLEEEKQWGKLELVASLAEKIWDDKE